MRNLEELEARIYQLEKLVNNGLHSRYLSPVIIEQRCTGNSTTSGTTETDLTGATISITPPIPSVALVMGTFRLASHSVGGDVFLGLLDVDGTNEGASVIMPTGSSADGDGTFSTHWVVSLTAAAHTIKLQGVRNSGTGTGTFGATASKLTVVLFGSANATDDTSA